MDKFDMSIGAISILKWHVYLFLTKHVKKLPHKRWIWKRKYFNDQSKKI